MPNESTQTLEASGKLRSELAAELVRAFARDVVRRHRYQPRNLRAVRNGSDGIGRERGGGSRPRDRVGRCAEHDRSFAGPRSALAGGRDGLPPRQCPAGRNYDGAAGVIAGLLALIEAKTQGAPRRSMEVYALRGEESAWFGGPCYFGSRAIFGQIEASDLASRHRDTGSTLAEQMVASGADMTIIEGKQTIRPAEDFHAWFELHIEQGPVLIAKEKPVGIVTGIRGNTRRRHVTCVGEAAHSGAVPRWLRHDAVLAMSELLMRLDEHWRVLLAWGEDLVFTTGIVETDPTEHAVSRVPGQVTFAIEFRSQDKKTIENFSKILVTECEKIGGERGVRFDLGDAVSSAPAKMSEKMVALVEGEAQAAGLDYEIMPSGAGHDTAVFANAGVPATMIFVRNDKGSHNPHEAMDMADFARGTDLLTRSMIKAANSAEDLRA